MKTKIGRNPKTNQSSSKKTQSIFTFVQGKSSQKWRDHIFSEKIERFIFVFGDTALTQGLFESNVFVRSNVPRAFRGSPARPDRPRICVTAERSMERCGRERIQLIFWVFLESDERRRSVATNAQHSVCHRRIPACTQRV